MRYMICLLLILSGFILPEEAMAVTYQLVTPDGVTFDLTGTGLAVKGVEAWGMPPVEHHWRRVPQQDGGVLDAIRAQPRVITISEHVFGSSRSNMHTLIASVLTNVRWDRTSTLQPLKLRYTVGANSADLYCYFDSEIREDVGAWSRIVGIRLIAYDPYWYAITESSTGDLYCTTSLAVSYILGKVDDAWTAMGNTGTGVVRAIVVDSNDDLYVASQGANEHGIAEADYIAKWTQSTTTWSALDDGANDSVYSLALGPDGLLYAGGAFTSMSAVANTDGIAVWNGTAWAAMDTGTDGMEPVYAMAIDSQGNLYAGGSFATMSGVANTAKIAKWNGTAWSALDVGLDGNVWGLAIDANDDVYVVGAFTDVAGGPTGTYNRIIKWDSSASTWEALGTGLNGIGYDCDIDSAGTLYVAGAFTTANGVTCNRSAAWNGATFSPLDTGLDNTAYFLDVSPNDEVWFGGVFTTASGRSAPGVARWNGTTWQCVDFRLPGTPTAYTFAWDSGGDFFVGCDTAGEALVSTISTITNSGSIGTPPTIEIDGAGTLVSICNETTGVEIPANLYINEDEQITIDMGDPGDVPSQVEITTDWDGRPNKDLLLGKLLAPAELGTFRLEATPLATSGQNKIGIFVTGNPVEAGDTNNQLSRYAGITGVAAAESDNGKLYFSIKADDGESGWHVDIYKDSARTNLVGHTANYTTTGSKAVSEDNSSGLGGAIYVDVVETLGAELLSNEGFETAGGGGADIWADWTENAGDGALANEGVIIHGGADAAKMTAGSSLNTSAEQAAVVTAAKVYKITFYARGDGTYDGRYQIRDATGAANIVALTGTGVTGTTYTQVVVYVTTPAGCVSMNTLLYCPGTDTGIAYFDDVSVKECTVGANAGISAQYALATIKHYNRYITADDAIT